jgi:hypothetical protein
MSADHCAHRASGVRERVEAAFKGSSEAVATLPGGDHSTHEFWRKNGVARTKRALLRLETRQNPVAPLIRAKMRGL